MLILLKRTFLTTFYGLYWKKLIAYNKSNYSVVIQMLRFSFYSEKSSLAGIWTRVEWVHFILVLRTTLYTYHVHKSLPLFHQVLNAVLQLKSRKYLVLSCNLVSSISPVNLLPASKASREVSNLTWRKNPHTPVHGVKEFVCLSVGLSVCLSVCSEIWPQLSQDWQNRIWYCIHLWHHIPAK